MTDQYKQVAQNEDNQILIVNLQKERHANRELCIKYAELESELLSTKRELHNFKLKDEAGQKIMQEMIQNLKLESNKEESEDE